MELTTFERAARGAALLAATLLIAACGTITTSSTPAPVVDATVMRTATPAELPASAPSGSASAPSAAPPKVAAPRAGQVPSDAVPRIERIASGYPNRPYAIRGEPFEPENTDVPIREVGIASWYGVPFHGRISSSGERYDMNKMTAAHPTMPLPSYALVRNVANGRQVVVRVNDRGPFYGGRIIDLSRAAARKLRIDGTALVEVERLTNDDIRTGAWRERHPTDLAKAPEGGRRSAQKAVPAQTVARVERQPALR